MGAILKATVSPQHTYWLRLEGLSENLNVYIQKQRSCIWMIYCTCVERANAATHKRAEYSTVLAFDYFEC